jgi:hypothetical protein
MALAGEPARERAAHELRRHYLAGRLSEQELDRRLEVALGARTRGEVRRATAQLPPRWADVDEVVPALRNGVERVRPAALVAVIWLALSALLYRRTVVSRRRLAQPYPRGRLPRSSV